MRRTVSGDVLKGGAQLFLRVYTKTYMCTCTSDGSIDDLMKDERRKGERVSMRYGDGMSQLGWTSVESLFPSDVMVDILEDNRYSVNCT